MNKVCDEYSSKSVLERAAFISCGGPETEPFRALSSVDINLFESIPKDDDISSITDVSFAYFRIITI